MENRNWCEIKAFPWSRHKYDMFFHITACDRNLGECCVLQVTS